MCPLQLYGRLYGKVFSHVAAVLFTVEASTQMKQQFFLHIFAMFMATQLILECANQEYRFYYPTSQAGTVSE